MNLHRLLQLIAILQYFSHAHGNHLLGVKRRILAEVRGIDGGRYHRAIRYVPPHQGHRSHLNHRRHSPSQRRNHFHAKSLPLHSSKRYHGSHWHNGQLVHRWHHRHHGHHGHHHHNRWQPRRCAIDRHQCNEWSGWTVCGKDCVRRRERFCSGKPKCGHATKHVEEQKCWSCQPETAWHPSNGHDESPRTQQQQQQQQTINQEATRPQSIIINAAAAAAVNGPPLQPPPPLPPSFTPTALAVHVHQKHQIRVPVLQEFINDHETKYETLNNPYDEYRDDDHRHYPQQHQHHHIPYHLPDQPRQPYASLSTPYWPADSEEEIGPAPAESDFFVLKAKPPARYRKRPHTPVLIDAADYDDLVDEQTEDNDFMYDRPHRLRNGRQRKRHQEKQKTPHRQRNRVRNRNLTPMNVNGDIEGSDTFQNEDFDFDTDDDTNHGVETQYPIGSSSSSGSGSSDSYEDVDYAEYQNVSIFSREKATPDALIPRHRRVYSKWSRWTRCSPKCTTRRYKKCRVREHCGREVLREIAYCYTEGSFCQQWLQAQMQKSPPYEVRPVAASRRRDFSMDGGLESNSIVNDFIMNGKGYRGPEYTPQKLKCGIAAVRNNNNNKRHMYNMLKIIGGKAARKGEWPWQVAIFNRFKEAFCGGTLIAPQWVLTAAHCVRKVLYVRLGEHNLDYEDGSEQQYRVLKSFKHPNFDKKTVDSDVALLRLPKPINATAWIGYSCLPRPYQPLPKNIDCTIIGWGKRRSRDVAGTSVLHEADVPIISMNNCRLVYPDYNITKNMFCAGHKRGRIDTCAGDSGGPLLCRDTTKPNHPWTIFGITSFGDGCAKRNKFGIYAKVPNYVDWVWSVINCNGNCKMHQRNY